MGILKKSTPKKSEMKIVPDEQDGTAPFVKSDKSMTGEGDRDGAFTEKGGVVGELAVDVFQTPDEIVVVAPVAGVTSDDLAINITEGVLVISGQRHLEFDVAQADYFTQECFWGSFSRSIILPEAVDATSVTASFKDGILTVRIPKIEKIHTRMVEIREE